MKYLGVIPARGGSKGIKGKNKKLLNGKPLIQYTIEAAIGSKIQLVVSTDDEDISEIAKQFNIQVIKRHKELAQDDTPTLPVLQHALEQVGIDVDAVITLQPTSPLRTSIHIDEAIDIFEGDLNADSLVSIVKVPHNMVPESIMTIKNNYLVSREKSQLLRRQDKFIYYGRNGAAIYITKVAQLTKGVFGGNILPYEMNKHHSVDIDDAHDWFLAEILLNESSNK